MSVIRRDGSDLDLHHVDGTHRWLCPNPYASEWAQIVWHSRVMVHMREHENRGADAQAQR